MTNENADLIREIMPLVAGLVIFTLLWLLGNRVQLGLSTKYPRLYLMIILVILSPLIAAMIGAVGTAAFGQDFGTAYATHIWNPIFGWIPGVNLIKIGG